MNQIGWDCDYDLGGTLFDFHKINFEQKINLSMSFGTDFGDYEIFDNGVSLGYGVDFNELLKGVTIAEAIDRVLQLSFGGDKTTEALEAQEQLLIALRAGSTEFDVSYSGNREIDIWCSEFTESQNTKTPKEPNQTSTDCRTEVGVTVGLIDGIIAMARVLSNSDLSSPEVVEALKDLRADEDIQKLFSEK